MTISFRCPSCNRRLRGEDEHAGRTVQCPSCQETVMIPAGEVSPSPPDPFPVPPTFHNTADSNETYSQGTLPFAPEIKRSSSQFSRAIFIFLAVFVGIFGIHDFYVKRARQGWIHLALLSPWIFVFAVSILIVFGYSLYVGSYSPQHKEIRECQRALKDCAKEIKDMERARLELLQKLEEARAGKLRKPKEIIPQQDQPREIVPPQDQPREIIPPQQRPREIVPSQEKPREIVPPANVDLKFVQELEDSLRDLELSLRDLQRRYEMLEMTLADLKIRQGAEKLPGWVSTGLLWAYFFFFVLPVISWAMAMFEIIYVTKDGSGKELCS